MNKQAFTNQYLADMTAAQDAKAARQALRDAEKWSAYRQSVSRYLRGGKIFASSFRRPGAGPITRSQIIAAARAMAKVDAKKSSGERLKMRAREFLQWSEGQQQ